MEDNSTASQQSLGGKQEQNTDSEDDYAAEDDSPQIEQLPDEDDLVDAGLAAAQDSVKTVITQSFRAFAYAANSVASLVLTAHDHGTTYSDSPKALAQPAGSSSSEGVQEKVPELVDSKPMSLSTKRMPKPRTASDDAFSSLFHELDDSVFSLPGTPRGSTLSNTLPSRNTSDFQLNFLTSSSNEEEEDLPEGPPTDDDVYTEVGSRGSDFHGSQVQTTTTTMTTTQNGTIQVSVRSISQRLTQPIVFVSSFFNQREEDSELDGITHINSPSQYYFTPPVTPFANARKASLRGFKSSLRKMSFGSFHSIKGAISGWRENRKMISAEPVPNASNTQSGLFEDIEMFLLERVDLTFFAARNLAKKMKHENGAKKNLALTPRRQRRKTTRKQRFVFKKFLRDLLTLRIPRSIFSTAKHVICHPLGSMDEATRRFIHLENVDELEGVGEIVRKQGYPYEEIFVCTRDGYILRLERIPNVKSKRVLFMQHGVMDSSFTWVANGADGSLAFRAHDAGYDVFLGNFRGAGGDGARRHVNPNISDDEYWDFSINEHAFEDIPAFVNAIVRTKMSELSNKDNVGEEASEPPTVVGVAHSMGGAAMLMYLLNEKQHNRRHFLDGMVLVSPAGVHEDSPLYARYGGRMVDLTLAKMVNSLRLPTDALTRATVKLVQDIKNNVPAVENIISLVVVYALGGDPKQPRRGPFSTVQQLTYNVLTCGTSTKVFSHLRQFIVTKRFQAFDYEPTAIPNHRTSKKGGNMEHYGQETPPEYTCMYDKIDVPVHLIAGLGDKLIGPTNVLRHYEAMKKHGVDVTIESFERCGHADFTCGLHTGALRGILSAVDKTVDRIITKRRRMLALKRKKLITPHFDISKK
uniref:Partial AB-hydrolase lipase domain-containing protein n=1 Tax=Mucochytrium quahogii TaxID=96639 RepID=A0A7S2W250_9STRA|mmetsp:Transcript_10491/g.22800  ORF Transcript_10491/g.22800 Transcript_10491/m.22800 type:complete len:865 (+) Transcript_10491:102-2696(+)